MIRFKNNVLPVWIQWDGDEEYFERAKQSIIDDIKLNGLDHYTGYADILEVGVPHNTPVADGSQIQTSAYRAIKGGIKIKNIFKIVKNFKKKKNSKPIILMGYYNMIYQYGENKFLNDCKKSGVSGLIVVDLPWFGLVGAILRLNGESNTELEFFH